MEIYVFTFDKSDKIYKPGETVNCKVQINVFSKFKARSLCIRFKGFAHTRWLISRTWGRNNRDPLPYTGDEEYFKNYQYILGGEQYTEREVPVGTHTYNVSFVLPQNISSKLEF